MGGGGGREVWGREGRVEGILCLEWATLSTTVCLCLRQLGSVHTHNNTCLPTAYQHALSFRHEHRNTPHPKNPNSHYPCQLSLLTTEHPYFARCLPDFAGLCLVGTPTVSPSNSRCCRGCPRLSVCPLILWDCGQRPSSMPWTQSKHRKSSSNGRLSTIYMCASLQTRSLLYSCTQCTSSTSLLDAVLLCGCLSNL